MENLQTLRDHLVKLLRGGQAYETFDTILGSFPPPVRDVVPSGAQHSAWQILEHLRISQRDILDFCRNENGDYRALKWPEEYWPASASPADPDWWESTAEAFRRDRFALESLASDPKNDLFTPFPWGDGQTLLREILIAAEHQAYHLGQLVILRRLLKT